MRDLKSFVFLKEKAKVFEDYIVFNPLFALSSTSMSSFIHGSFDVFI